MTKKKDDVIIYLKNNDLLVGTGMLSKGFNVEHRALKKLIVKYKSEFETLGIIAFRMQQIKNRKVGRQLEEYELNEPQSTYLATLLTNNKEVRAFKLKLVDKFFKMRKTLAKMLAQKQNAEWLEKRDSGKIERRRETDTIKEFVEYSNNQGSKNSNKYYMIISKMQNNTIFNLDVLGLKFPNIRDLVSGYQLATLENADRIVARALKEGMQQEMFYKDIYKLAKERIERFVDLIGETPINNMLEKEKKLKLA